MALDPCQNFYAYTCNKWIDNHMIPSTQPVVNLPSITTQSIRYRLHQLLLAPYPHSETNALPNPDKILDRQLFDKLTDIYQSCLNSHEEGVKVLYPIFREIQRLVPLEGHDNKGLNNAIAYLADRGVWSLFEVKIGPDLLDNPSKPSVHLLPAPLPQSDDREGYLHVVSGILELVFKQDNEFGWRSWSSVATARRIIEFEQQWIMESTQMERWKTPEELAKEAPGIDWTTWAHGQQRPILADRALLKKIQESTAVNSRTLQMYLVWRTLWTYLDTLGESFKEYRQRLEAIQLGINPDARPERWETCLSLIDQDSYMGPLLGRYFVLDTHPAIEQVDWMAQKIVSRLQEKMTNERIIKKLRGMQFEIGYATHASLDIMSVLSLTEYYGEVQTDREASLFDNVKSVKMQAVKQMWKELKQNQVKPPVFNPTSTEVLYRYEYNQVIIPAGVLQFPYFDVQGPEYLYQGTLGWMIGQAVMHGFDQVGKRYNEKGLLGDWWKNDESSCLISQYETFGLDGDQTWNNNFADNGALMLYDSTENITIPGLDHWTKEQLFYIQFARMKCSKSTREYQLINKNKAPDQYRFAKQLETESENIPLEWRPYLIQYKSLKKLINKVTQEIESRGLSVSLLQNDKNIKYYFTGEPPHVKPNIEFTYDTNEAQEEILSRLRTSRPKLEYKTSYSNKDVFSINKFNQSKDVVDIMKELLSMTLEEKSGNEQRRSIVIQLEQDNEFFETLLNELTEAHKLQDETAEKFKNQVVTLQTELTRLASPSQQDMYHWRKIFAVYMDSCIFQNTTNVDKSKRQMQWFLDELNKTNQLKRLKSKESKRCFEQFIALNTQLITVKHYQLLNQTAMRKILKKHDKQSGLSASHVFPQLVSVDQLLDSKLAVMLYASITDKLTSIIPQPDDYACPICMSVAWRPIRLECDHVFCVRCLVKAQKKRMPSCPLCRHPTAVSDATANNLDEGLQNFLKLYFPQEIKMKRRENEREQAIEDIEAMTGKRYTEEQLLRMNSPTKCCIM
ncbi:hypothetical protein G6F37_006146 [Rhizopus arrhizus]|nr:hypothetical protein G6F38_008051 [Rhizopus arrhizus]KAG1158061.1 hypothetical protein G6F37_006146 [Rhizopus arrhizus]